MDIARAGAKPSARGPADWFTGTVRIDPLFAVAEPSRAAGNAVTFEPGARTAWHTHPLGQILIVTTLIFVFYVVFGLFSVIPTTIEQWTGSTDLETILDLPALGGEIVLTWELVRTALFIAAVAGLQFTVAALTDESYRTTFYERITDRIRVTLAVRALYRAVVDRAATTPVAG